MGKWTGGSVGGRGDRDRPDGWDDPRRNEDEPQHDTQRLTDEERYGVQSNGWPEGRK